MTKNVLLVTHNPNRYKSNTQMEKVITYLCKRSEFYSIDISEKAGDQNLFGEIEKISVKNNIKVLLFIDGPPVLLLSVNEISKLRRMFVISMFFGDIFAHFHSLYKYYAQSVDIALVDEAIEVGSFQKFCPEVIFVPYSYEIDYDLEPTISTIPTLSFVGRTDRRNRSRYLNICTEYAEVKIFGVGSEGGPLSDLEMKQVFNSSLINLNFTGVQEDQPFIHSRPIDNITRSPKGRCQEIGMCGGFVLSEYAPGIDQMFSVGDDMDVFHDEKELREKLEFYLKNPQVIMEMAKRHRANCHKNYSIEQVWNSTIEKISNAKVQRFEAEYFIDDILKIAESRSWVAYLKPILERRSISDIFIYLRKFGWMNSLRFSRIYITARFFK